MAVSLLVPNLKGEVAAAWVQAIGSIGAIGGAVWIARAGERKRTAQAARSGETFLQRAVESIENLWAVFRKNDPIRALKAARQFALRANELIELSRRIDVSELDKDQQWSIFDMVGLLHDTRMTLEGVGILHSPSPYSDMAGAVLVHMHAARDIAKEYGLEIAEMHA